MTPAEIQTIRTRALQIVERMGVSRREASLIYRKQGVSARSGELFLRGDARYQTQGMAAATLLAFPEIGSLSLHIND